MVIIKPNVKLRPEQMAILEETIRRQAKIGVIALPHYCEVLAKDPDEAVEIVQQNNTDRVAELERQLAAAMEYITATKDCDTCKFAGSIPECPIDCIDCPCDGNTCPCKICFDGSKWEWRHGHG